MGCKIDFDNLHIVVEMVPAAAVRKFSIFDSNYVYVGTFCACSTGMNHKFQLSVWTLAVTRRYGPVCPNINTLFHNLFTFTTTPTLWLLSRNSQTKSLMNHFNHHDSSLNYKSTRNHFTIVVPWFQLLCYSSFYSAALKNWISDCNCAE